MENTTHVRLATYEDAAELVRLNDEFNGVGASVSDVENSLQHSNEIVLIGFLNQKAVGFICGQLYRSFCYAELQGEMTELYVMEEARRRGIAAQLIHQLEQEMVRRGGRSIKVLTGERNAAARRTYEQSNYVLSNEIMLQKKV